MSGASRRRLAAVLAVALAAAWAWTGARAAAPAPRLAFVYAGGESTGPAEIRRAVEPLGIEAAVFAPGTGGDRLDEHTDLSAFDVVFVDGATEGLARYAAQLQAARERTRVVVVHPHDAITGNVPLAAHPWIAAYWSNPSQENYERLARYLAARVAARPSGDAAVQPPVVYPPQGFYHPGADALFPSAEAYLAWYRGRGASGAAHGYDPARLTVGIFFNLTTYQLRNLEYIDALIGAVEQRGQNVVALAYRTAPVLGGFLVDGRPAVDVLIFAGSVLNPKDRAAALEDARQLGVPVLGAFTHGGVTPEGFAASATGLHPTLTPAVVDAERDGRIEPIVVAAKGAAIGDRTTMAPMAAQVRWRVDRALAWARLRRTPNRQKKVVFTFWSEGGGKANVGGDPDDFLDVPASLVRLFGALQQRGYDLGTAPLPDRDALVRRMATSASNVGTWAPGELAARVARHEVRLIPEETYQRWFEALPEARRAEIVAAWGPPPGNVMVHRDRDGRRYLVIPAIELGNVLVAPHPDWGYLQDASALMSTGALPPHHQYLAFFLWLQHEWHADAWVSLFTNLSLQPGKPEGPAADDHVALLLGALPHIHPERLGSNGGVANKRKTLAQTVGWFNVVGATGTDDERALAPVGTKVLGEAPAGEARVGMVAAMLGPELAGALDALAPDGSRAAVDLVRAVLDEQAAPADALRARFGRSQPEAEAQLAKAADYAARLAAAPREVDAILEALEGGWIEPGPMDDPVRRPDALPPGRSLYNFNQAAIPTVEAEAVGVRQADALIAAHREKHGGAYPATLAFVLWSGEIAKNLGVTEAQILHLLGTRPVRNARGEVTGVELIPREALGRPRVNVVVTTSGTYRDHYQDKVELIAEAVRLASASPEADNPVAAATRSSRATLEASGAPAERAEKLAEARVFAPAPGAYSPNIQFLAKAGDQRGDEARMAELYTSRMSHAYGAGLAGESARPVFEQQASGIDAVTLSRSGSVNGMLDQPMSAGFLGGLGLAARAAGAANVDLYVSNLREPGQASIQTAAEAVRSEMRTRYFNEQWLRQMQAHGYDGARNLMFFTDNLDLWDSTATETVSSEDWAEVKRVYVEDSLHLDLDRFFDRHNPYAQQVLLANLLGAASRGQWQATREDLAAVASRLARSAAEHGAVCEAALCRNPALTAFVAEALAGAPRGAALAAGYRDAIARATTAAPAPAATSSASTSPAATSPGAGGTAPGRSTVPAGTAGRAAGNPAGSPASSPAASSLPTVTGFALSQAQAPASAAPASSPHRMGWLLAAALLLVASGWLAASRQAGRASTRRA